MGCQDSAVVMLEVAHKVLKQDQVVVAKSVVDEGCDDIPLWILNPKMKERVLFQKSVVAECEPIEPIRW